MLWRYLDDPELQPDDVVMLSRDYQPTPEHRAACEQECEQVREWWLSHYEWRPIKTDPDGRTHYGIFPR
jgi:hypothetical protein